MKVVEEFSTLQGEGRYLGVPSYFVRTTGCNLRCAWPNKDGTTTLCDTPYTSWNAESGWETNGIDIYHKIRGKKIKHVVITGGEPTLQPDLAEVVNFLHGKGLKVTIETNGTRFVVLPHDTFISISPKTSNSYSQKLGSIEEKIHKRNNVFDESLKMWIKSNEYQLKFVYNGHSDVKEIEGIVEKAGANNSNVYLMPQGISTKQFVEKQKELFELCMHKGWIYTPRLHIEVYGNVRGI